MQIPTEWIREFSGFDATNEQMVNQLTMDWDGSIIVIIGVIHLLAIVVDLSDVAPC